jgi:hypothetical protein
MYFAVSSTLIERNPLDKQLIRQLDREIAHGYASDGHGYIEYNYLMSRMAAPDGALRRLLDSYEDARAVARYIQVQCSCSEVCDPEDETCMSCGRQLTEAQQNGRVCYRVTAQPAAPTFQLPAVGKAHDIFISYRRADSTRLAADIFYTMRAEGYSVFLDDGSIPPGADAQRMFLRAASEAKYFIALISEHYFDSDFCKLEVAHAARVRSRLIRVNVPPVPPPPADMPWIDGPNWVKYSGDNRGLDTEIEGALLGSVGIESNSNTLADCRRESCQFLMDLMSRNELFELWNRLTWMTELDPTGSNQMIMRLILQETTAARLPVLCNALAP